MNQNQITQSLRVFIAVDPSPDFQRRLVTLTADMRTHFKRFVRWQDPEKAHLTLAFLGELERGKLATIRQLCRELISSQKIFPLQFEHTGVFPEKGKPRVLWLGCLPNPSLEYLVSELRAGLKQGGIVFDRKPFHPHITLARFDPELGSNTATELIAMAKKLELGGLNEQPVKSVTIYQSELNRTGAHYTPLAEFALKL